MNSFYSKSELKRLGFKTFGENVLISKKASIYGAKNISLGNNIRIDDFCILSGHISLGNYIHIAAYSALFGGDAGIVFEDYSCISSRVAVYAVSDDYSGASLTNPTVPDKYRNVTKSCVNLKKHVLVGTGSTILPGVTIEEGTSVGSMSLVNKSFASWGKKLGIPCRKIKDRSKNLLFLEEELNREENI